MRRWLAEVLAPQVFNDQRAYERLKAEAIDAYHWLGSCPDARDALRWLLDNDQNRRRAIGERAVGSLPYRIDQFREFLERRQQKTSEPLGSSNFPAEANSRTL